MASHRPISVSTSKSPLRTVISARGVMNALISLVTSRPLAASKDTAYMLVNRWLR